jgi:hypothetical protein
MRTVNGLAAPKELAIKTFSKLYFWYFVLLANAACKPNNCYSF